MDLSCNFNGAAVPGNVHFFADMIGIFGSDFDLVGAMLGLDVEDQHSSIIQMPDIGMKSINTANEWRAVAIMKTAFGRGGWHTKKLQQ